ncbi:MAG: TIGR03915 family putative DNA repair protein [Oscillospiraceae bacterium]|nr:TIGR03915 family putative DNA repair protein [Oscillospiraceae bacterium]MCL2227835.1 TIGR03915 family putative DNA repair protein [Oscillospiraceae bacterium]
MPCIKPLEKCDSAIYVYDGSFHGFLCCVYERFYSEVMPVDIVASDDEPITLYAVHTVLTNAEKAERVLASISEKISPEARHLIETVFLSCLKQKELLMLNFLLRGYREGRRILSKLGDPDVAPLLKAQKHLLGESHLLKGFIRFSDYDGSLAATITPKNFILPFIASHFTQRFSNENLLIFDKTHKAALVYQNRRMEIISVDNIEFPPISEEEGRYQAMWKRFYATVSIQARENLRCRMTLMPKRYWENMLEVQDLC